METFYNNLDTKVPVWCISHAGHYDLPGVLPLNGKNIKIKPAKRLMVLMNYKFMEFKN